MRRPLVCLVLAAALAGAVGARAQDRARAWNPRSGDAWVDAQLADINRYGLRYRDPFVDEMTRYHGAPRELVGELLLRHWAPGDIYFACALAQVAGRPCRDVADAWESAHAQGWGALARRLGVQPGSPGFHRLKRGFVPSFDHWGRPIALDASLAADFPGRASRKADAGANPGRGMAPRQDDAAGRAPAALPWPAGGGARGHTAHGRGGGHGHGHG